MKVATVFDVTAEDFTVDVVERSRTTPVLLDFWADWCGPCRTLGPILEKLAGEYGGAFVLGKVDTEREPELAQAFQVQSIPFCVLIHRGRPVDGFAGAVGEPELRRFLQRHGIKPLAPEEPEPAAVDPASPEGRLQAALAAVAQGDAAAAAAAVEGFPEEDERIDRVERLRQGLPFLTENLREGAPGAEGALAEARRHFLAGEHEAAMAAILTAAGTDRAFRQGLPRRAMVLCFLVVGEDDPVCDDYRRRLATLLY